MPETNQVSTVYSDVAVPYLLFVLHVMLFRPRIIIIIITLITSMQAIYNYIPETNQVSRVYSVAAVLYLQFVLHVVLCRPLLLLILLLLRSLLSHAFSSRYLSS